MYWFLKFAFFPMLFPIYYSDFIPQWLITSLFSPYVISYARFYHFSSDYGSSNLTFKGKHVSFLYSQPQQYGMEHTQLLVLFSSMRGLTRKKCLRSVELLLNIVLVLYVVQILCIFSDMLLTLSRQTVTVFFSLWSTFLYVHMS